MVLFGFAAREDLHLTSTLRQLEVVYLMKKYSFDLTDNNIHWFSTLPLLSIKYHHHLWFTLWSGRFLLKKIELICVDRWGQMDYACRQSWPDFFLVLDYLLIVSTGVWHVWTHVRIIGSDFVRRIFCRQPWYFYNVSKIYRFIYAAEIWIFICYLSLLFLLKTCFCLFFHWNSR